MARPYPFPLGFGPLIPVKLVVCVGLCADGICGSRPYISAQCHLLGFSFYISLVLQCLCRKFESAKSSYLLLPVCLYGPVLTFVSLSAKHLSSYGDRNLSPRFQQGVHAP
jgi:hypothetical protein